MIHAALLLSMILAASAAHAACRQALVLGLDVSGSVDAREYRLQLDGLAAALEDRQVRQALLETPDTPVALAVFEWSGSGFQRVLADWTLATATSLPQLSATLRGTTRQPAPSATSIGGALRFARTMHDRAPDCWVRTVDISGDGRNNDHPRPQDVLTTWSGGSITVNALVIGTEIEGRDDIGLGGVAELSSYFQAQVIHGPGAFVEVTVGFEDYQAAMMRKLLKELQTAVIGQVTPRRAAASARHRARNLVRRDTR